jgi:hypothetical protein
MILTALPAWVDGAARDLGVIAGIVVALGVITAKTPLGRIVRWLYKRLFGQPLTDWAQRTIHGVVGPEIAALSGRNDEQHAENGERLAHIEHEQAVMKRELEVVSGIVSAHGDRLDKGSGRMDDIFGALDGLQKDVAVLRSRPSLPEPSSKDDAA